MNILLFARRSLHPPHPARSRGFHRPASAASVTLAIGVCGLCVQQAMAASVNLINDTELAVASFTAYSINTSGGFSFAVGQALVGGNLDAYRTISHSSVDGTAQGVVIHKHITTWTPSTDGALESIDFGIDVNCFNGGTSGAVGFGLILEQDGVVYYGPQVTAFPGWGWRTDLRRTVLIASEFLFDFNAPDFSATGSTITFGFYSSNGTASGVPISSSSGVDNFTVTLNLAPECAGDINGDGKTNTADFNLFAGHFGQAVTPNTNGDLTGDGFVDTADFNVFAGDFGCGS